MMPGVPGDVRAAASSLLAQSVHLVAFAFAGPLPPFLHGIHWLYFPEPDAIFYRVTILSNLSPNVIPRRFRGTGAYVILTETGSSAHTPLPPGNLTDLVRTSLHGANLTLGEELMSFSTNRSHGYPVPSRGRDTALGTVEAYLARMGVRSRGRFGGWKYEVANQDHSCAQGFEAADAILDRVSRDEPTYHVPPQVNGRYNKESESERERERAAEVTRLELVLDGVGLGCDVLQPAFALARRWADAVDAERVAAGRQYWHTIHLWVDEPCVATTATSTTDAAALHVLLVGSRGPRGSGALAHVDSVLRRTLAGALSDYILFATLGRPSALHCPRAVLQTLSSTGVEPWSVARLEGGEGGDGGTATSAFALTAEAAAFLIATWRPTDDMISQNLSALAAAAVGEGRTLSHVHVACTGEEGEGGDASSVCSTNRRLVLITGAAGALGRVLTATLLSTDTTVHVVALDRVPRSDFPAHPRLTYHALDLGPRTTANLTAILTSLSPCLRSIVHLAALARVTACEGDPARCRRDNVESAATLVAALAAAGRPDMPVVFTSTREVYGQLGRGEAVDEASLVQPINEYGRSKVAAEGVLRAGLTSLVIVRLTNLYGSWADDRTRLVPSLVCRAKVGAPLLLVAPTETMVNLLPYEDAARAVLTLLDRMEEGETVPRLLNVGSTEVWPLTQLASYIVNLTSSSSPVQSLCGAATVPTRFAATLARQAEALGVDFGSRVSLAAGVAAFIKDWPYGEWGCGSLEEDEAAILALHPREGT
jgi:nucleoside-diphosphate-sugar epimerase